MTAPVVAIIGMDMEFHKKIPRLFPPDRPRAVFRGQTGEKPHHGLAQWFVAEAYFNLAARGLGLDSGAMSDFDNEEMNAEYFSDGKLKSDFICAIGYGDASRLHPREPRLEFNEVAQISWPRRKIFLSLMQTEF